MVGEGSFTNPTAAWHHQFPTNGVSRVKTNKQEYIMMTMIMVFLVTMVTIVMMMMVIVMMVMSILMSSELSLRPGLGMHTDHSSHLSNNKM